MKNYNKKASNSNISTVKVNDKGKKKDITIENMIDRAINMKLDPLKHTDLSIKEYIKAESEKKKEKIR